MAWLDSPSATRASTSRSRSVSWSRGPAGVGGRKAGRRSWGRRRFSVGEAAECVDQVRDVADAVFEQVAEPFGLLFEQPHGLVRLDELGEDHNGGGSAGICWAATRPSSRAVGG